MRASCQKLVKEMQNICCEESFGADIDPQRRWCILDESQREVIPINRFYARHVFKSSAVT